MNLDYHRQDMFKEIAAIIEPLNKVLSAYPTSKVVMQIIANNSDEYTSDHLRFCQYNTVTKFVAEYIRKTTKQNDAHKAQLKIEGFPDVQCRYNVVRNNESWIVSIEDMTQQEMEAKCNEMLKNASKLTRHADQLKRAWEKVHNQLEII